MRRRRPPLGIGVGIQVRVKQFAGAHKTGPFGQLRDHLRCRPARLLGDGIGQTQTVSGQEGVIIHAIGKRPVDDIGGVNPAAGAERACFPVAPFGLHRLAGCAAGVFLELT